MKWYWWAALGTLGLLVFNRKRVMDNLQAIQLSPNFSLGEFIKTTTGFDNIPGADEIENLRNVVLRTLQPLRNFLGLPITVTSGYRSIDVNRAVGSNDTSQHIKGEAVDFRVIVGRWSKSQYTQQQALNEAISRVSRLGVTANQLVPMHEGNYWQWMISNRVIMHFIASLRLPYDQMIDEQIKGRHWVHLSLKRIGTNRARAMTYYPDQGQGYVTINVG